MTQLDSKPRGDDRVPPVTIEEQVGAATWARDAGRRRGFPDLPGKPWSAEAEEVARMLLAPVDAGQGRDEWGRPRDRRTGKARRV